MYEGEKNNTSLLMSHVCDQQHVVVSYFPNLITDRYCPFVSSRLLPVAKKWTNFLSHLFPPSLITTSKHGQRFACFSYTHFNLCDVQTEEDAFVNRTQYLPHQRQVKYQVGHVSYVSMPRPKK